MMKISAIAAVAAIALFMGSANAQTVRGTLPTGIDFAALSSAVTADFRDPGSAQFKTIVAGAKPTIVCGWVNAKNGFGGYTNFVPFIYYANAGKGSALTDFTNSHMHRLYLDLLGKVGCLKPLGL